ncbi:TonB family protein [Hyphomicrobium sp.]|uniref:TonB family protein n=1 Tax=Hyphomicrobium sp. TaxID=82 RepID=UPI002E31C995|nr:TonB family protein [Hyphomicrobium sp.]HEX2841019.1 TonB family protein [Hyphomicrobium sp.]
MMQAEAYFDTTVQRMTRWSGSASMIVALHVAAGAVALLAWPANDPREKSPTGAIMMDLASLAAESPSDQQEISEQPQFNLAAPPPSPVESLEETPPEPVKAVEPEPVQEKVAEAAEIPPTVEPASEPLPEMPAVEEAPLAPEPEVTLPKEVQKEVDKKPERPKEEAKEKVAEKAKSKEPVAKAAKKSDSSKAQQAAASAKGRFDPNPIYRASPAYPAGARSQKVEGYVVVSYSVSASGSVSNVSVVSASPPGIFNAATLAAVRQWRFKPSPQGAQGRRTTVRFKLR